MTISTNTAGTTLQKVGDLIESPVGCKHTCKVTSPLIRAVIAMVNAIATLVHWDAESVVTSELVRGAVCGVSLKRIGS